MSFHAQQFYEHRYHGVFISPLDYDLTCSKTTIGRAKMNYGQPINDEQKEAIERINKLEKLGGIQEPMSSDEAERIIADFLNSI